MSKSLHKQLIKRCPYKILQEIEVAGDIPDFRVRKCGRAVAAGRAFCIGHSRKVSPSAVREFTDLVAAMLRAGDCCFDGFLFPKGFSLFRRARFTADASFCDASFAGDADFSGSRFTGEVSFITTTVSGDAMFKASVFLGDAWFVAMRCRGSLLLTGAACRKRFDMTVTRVGGDVLMDGARVSDKADFMQNEIKGNLSMRSARVGGTMTLMTTNVGGNLDLKLTKVAHLVIDGVTVAGEILLSGLPRHGAARGKRIKA